jgi:hypothetical protein
MIVDESEGFGSWLAMMRLVSEQVRFQVSRRNGSWPNLAPNCCLFQDAERRTKVDGEEYDRSSRGCQRDLARYYEGS